VNSHSAGEQRPMRMTSGITVVGES